ncbi:MAG TPA: helix-turn-helix transcriptional regulator [Georgenia sp.]|nr:helix-turn-helix transcriptional regulator [Georgenia sp.]
MKRQKYSGGGESAVNQVSFGKKLKQLRREKRITQMDLAKILEVDNTTISKWESDIYEPEMTAIKKIADYFNVSIDYLLGRTDDPNPHTYDEKEAEKAFQKAIAAMKKEPHDKEYAMKKIREFMQIVVPELTGKKLTPGEYNIIMANIKAVIEAQEEQKHLR